MKLIVFTSALNEEETIGEMLDRIPKKITGIDQIVKMVLSDGSTDSTAEIARQKGAIVLENKTQKRLAFSFRRLVDRAIKENADIAVNIDADLQFRPEEIPDIIKPILDGKADFVAADRFTDKNTGKIRKPKNMPTGKYYSNRLGSWIVSKLTGYKFPDVTCGFRAYNKEALLRLNLNSQYTYTQESFQVLALAKLDIESMPVSIKYYPGRKSRVVTSFISFLFSSAINIIRAFRDFAPLQFFGLLGGLLFMIGLVLDLVVFFHYFNTGSFTPFISVILVGVYLNTLGIIAWIIGLVADMLDRIRNNQDKILYEIKLLRYQNK